MLHGQAGDDSLVGGAGFFTDALIGGDGRDTLRGDSGASDYDVIEVARQQLYVLDTPADQVVEAPGGGTDTVVVDIAASAIP